MTVRYFILNIQECEARGYKWVEEDAGFIVADGPEDYGAVMLRAESMVEGEETVVGIGTETDTEAAPEDATLHRDYHWVLTELNRLAEELNQYEMDERERLG